MFRYLTKVDHTKITANHGSISHPANHQNGSPLSRCFSIADATHSFGGLHHYELKSLLQRDTPIFEGFPTGSERCVFATAQSQMLREVSAALNATYTQFVKQTSPNHTQRIQQVPYACGFKMVRK